MTKKKNVKKTMFCSCKKPQLGRLTGNNEVYYVCLKCSKEIVDKRIIKRLLEEERKSGYVVVGVGAFQQIIPTLTKKVGASYVIVNEKDDTIVGSVTVIEPPPVIVLRKTFYIAR